jgi:hypothetical protein
VLQLLVSVLPVLRLVSMMLVAIVTLVNHIIRALVSPFGAGSRPTHLRANTRAACRDSFGLSISSRRRGRRRRRGGRARHRTRFERGNRPLAHCRVVTSVAMRIRSTRRLHVVRLTERSSHARTHAMLRTHRTH